MIVIGLTGATGAGKSMIASRMRHRGWPIFDADKVVHQLQGPHGAAAPLIAQLWPNVLKNGVIDRAALRETVTRTPENLMRLEAIIHPMIQQLRRKFIKSMRAAHLRVCVLDIPLLIETGAHKDCDYVFVVQAPLSLRLRRIRARGAMTRREAEILMAHQANDARRCREADILLKTGLSKAHAVARLKRAVVTLDL